MTGVLAVAAEHDAAGNHDAAVNELARAAQRGDVEALVELGKRLLAGDRAPLLPNDGVGLLSDAYKAGSADAALRLAALAALGAHAPQSWSTALGLLAFAAERGSELGRRQLAVLAGDPDNAQTPASGWRALAQSVDLAAWLAAPAGVTLHERPTIRCFQDFVPASACDWLIGRARGQLKRALIYDAAHGGHVADHMRTNSAAGFDLTDTDLVQIAVQYRMSAAVGLPVANMEGPTVLHYEVGQQITDHFDFLNPGIPNYAEEIRRRGERIITFLVYLNDDYAGGETEFPLVGVRHKGKRREGLFFVNALPDGSPDRRMVHAGRPPSSGEKWIVSQFVRNRAALNARAERVA